MFDFDEYMFPVGQKARSHFGIFESCCGGKKGCNESCKGGVCEGDDDWDDEEDDDVYESSIDAFAKQDAKIKAMSAALAWGEDGDYSYDSFDSLVSGLVNDTDDPNYEFTEAESDTYDNIWEQVPHALASIGVPEIDIQAFIDGPSREADKAAMRIGNTIDDYLGSSKVEDGDIINSFAFGEDAVLESVSDPVYREIILEEAGKKKGKALVDGKVVNVFRVKRKNGKRIGPRPHLTSSQKATLKKARIKANTPAAIKKRKKKLKKEKKMGLI